jgi:hypothetical protein
MLFENQLILGQFMLASFFIVKYRLLYGVTILATANVSHIPKALRAVPLNGAAPGGGRFAKVKKLY